MFSRFGSSTEAPKAPPRRNLADNIKQRIDNAIGGLTGSNDRIRALESQNDQLAGQMGGLQVLNAENQAQIAEMVEALQAARADAEEGRTVNAFYMRKLTQAEAKASEMKDIELRAAKFVDSIFSEAAPPRYEDAASFMDVTPSQTEVTKATGYTAKPAAGTAATATTVVHVHMHEQPTRPVFVPKMADPVALPRISPPKTMTPLERLRAASELKVQEAQKKKQEQAEMMQAEFVANSATTISDIRKREQTISALRSKINANRILMWTTIKDWFMEKMAEKAQLEISSDLPEAAKQAALKTYPAVRNLQNAACAWVNVEAKNSNGVTYYPNREFETLLNTQNDKLLKELNDLGCPDKIHHFLSLSKFEELDPELSDPAVKAMLYVKKPIPLPQED